MSAAWVVPLQPVEKLVLLALADWANDDGVCWPSIKKLVEKTDASERTIQRAVSALVEKGHLTRVETLGRGVSYTVHPRQPDTPVTVTPPSECHPTPVTVTPYTSDTHHSSEANASSSAAQPVAKPKASAPTKGTRLPETWEPTPADLQFAANAGLTPEETARAALEFRNYWCARAGRDATKLRWDLTWNNRVLAVADRKRGASPAASGPGGHRPEARSMAEIVARRRLAARDREPLSG